MELRSQYIKLGILSTGGSAALIFGMGVILILWDIQKSVGNIAVVAAMGFAVLTGILGTASLAINVIGKNS